MGRRRNGTESQTATSRRRSATSAAENRKEIEIAVKHRNEHGIEITAVERRKKMAKEVESGGVETKENERSTKKS